MDYDAVRIPAIVRAESKSVIAARASESITVPPVGPDGRTGLCQSPAWRMTWPVARSNACIPSRGAANNQFPAIWQAIIPACPAQAPLAPLATIQHWPSAGLAGGEACVPSITRCSKASIRASASLTWPSFCDWPANSSGREKRGLVLVVGATGSGKSTTIASMLDHRNENFSGHILTIEDPIEYLFRHKASIVNQREIGTDTLDWNHALSNAMRQAPDCILIGEIRDRDTMQAAIAYAQTGHLCLATLHANNAYHALNRIFNFFPMENRPLLYMDLAATLKCIISQRLVKRPDGKRIPAVEILLNSRQVAELIERGEISGIREAMEQSLASGSRTFEQDLFRLYRDKIITLEEAMRTVPKAAPVVADIMMNELNKTEQWKSQQLDHFKKLAEHYLINIKP